MSMRAEQRAAYDRELALARTEDAAGRLEAAFAHLERAHIIGQRHPLAHARAHWLMLRNGWRRGDRREVLGQPMRILAALTKSLLWVPAGNTGGANVNPLQPMPIPPDLRPYLD